MTLSLLLSLSLSLSFLTLTFCYWRWHCPVIVVIVVVLSSSSFLTSTLTFCHCRFRLRVVIVIVYTTLWSWGGAASSPLEVRGGDGDLVFIRGPCVVFLTVCGRLVLAGCTGSCFWWAVLVLILDGLRWVLFLAGCARVQWDLVLFLHLRLRLRQGFDIGLLRWRCAAGIDRLPVRLWALALAEDDRFYFVLRTGRSWVDGVYAVYVARFSFLHHNNLYYDR